MSKVKNVSKEVILEEVTQDERGFMQKTKDFVVDHKGAFIAAGIGIVLGTLFCVAKNSDKYALSEDEELQLLEVEGYEE